MSEEKKAFEELQHVSPIKFSSNVLEMVESHETTFLEAVLYYCNQYDIEIESIKPLLTPKLLDKLSEEAQKNHTIKKQGRLEL